MMTEFDFVALGFTFVVERMGACIRVRLGAGILHDMFCRSARGVVISLVWSGRHDEWLCIECVDGLIDRIESKDLRE